MTVKSSWDAMKHDAGIKLQKSATPEAKLAYLIEAVDAFLDSQRSAEDVHDWSQCESDEQVEKKIAKTKYSISDAGCAYATLEEKLERCR